MQQTINASNGETTMVTDIGISIARQSLECSRRTTKVDDSGQLIAQAFAKRGRSLEVDIVTLEGGDDYFSLYGSMVSAMLFRIVDLSSNTGRMSY